MTEYIKKLYIPDKDFYKYQDMTGPGVLDYDANDLKSYETVASWTIRFPDGREMDIKVCSGDRSNHDPLWTEGVLFENGQELTHTEIKDAIDTEFTCETDTDDNTIRRTYVVRVLPESERPAA